MKTNSIQPTLRRDWSGWDWRTNPQPKNYKLTPRQKALLLSLSHGPMQWYYDDPDARALTRRGLAKYKACAYAWKYVITDKGRQVANPLRVIETEWERVNQRHCELLRKLVGEELLISEIPELARLNELVEVRTAYLSDEPEAQP